MNYYFWAPSQSNELYHYGVLGMKWGVHKVYSYNQRIRSNHYRRDRVEDRLRKRGEKLDNSDPRVQKWNNQNRDYDIKRTQAIKSVAEKSKAHLQYLDSKYQKKQAKADIAYAKAERKANSMFATKKTAERAFRKAGKAQYKANKVAYKGKEFYRQLMNETHLNSRYARKSLFYKSLDKETRKLGQEFVKRVERNSKAMYANSYR